MVMVVAGVETVVLVREFNPDTDCEAVVSLEGSCEVGPSSGKLSLFTDLLGDPLSRVRHSPSSLMLVAELDGGHIVGAVRGCIKVVTCGKKLVRAHKPGAAPAVSPVYTKLAYILGLRLSPSHRRMGIGFKLASAMEAWFRANGAECSYMATDTDNEPSVRLFTRRLGYSKFRTPAILVQPVFAHQAKVSSRVTIHRILPSDAEAIYQRHLATTEFFPRDIDAILRNKLSLATFLAAPASDPIYGSGADHFLVDPPASWAVLSVWNCKDVILIELNIKEKFRHTCSH